MTSTMLKGYSLSGGADGQRVGKDGVLGLWLQVHQISLFMADPHVLGQVCRALFVALQDEAAWRRLALWRWPELQTWRGPSSCAGWRLLVLQTWRGPTLTKRSLHTVSPKVIFSAHPARSWRCPSQRHTFLASGWSTTVQQVRGVPPF